MPLFKGAIFRKKGVLDNVAMKTSNLAYTEQESGKKMVIVILIGVSARKCDYIIIYVVFCSFSLLFVNGNEYIVRLCCENSL